MYPNVYIWIKINPISTMSSFKKKRFTTPIACKHNNVLSKDWYVFFQYKHEGKVHKFKRREGINRIKDLEQRISAINNLAEELLFDLKNSWNPILDPKRELDYNPYSYERNPLKYKRKKNNPLKDSAKKEILAKFLKGKGH